MSRNRKRRRDIADRRKSVAYFPPTGMHRLGQGDLHMLREDISHRLIPYGHRSNHWPDYKVSVEPHSEEATAALLEGLALEEREYELNSVFGGFVRRVADLILYQGEAFFEIVFDDDTEPKGFLIAPFPPGEVKVYEGVVTQIIPREVQAARQLVEPFVEIPERSVLRISFPPTLGGKRAALKLTSSLEALGSSIMPEFAEGDFTRVTQEFGFNVSNNYRELRDVALAKATAALGWDARSLMDNKITEFYKFHRNLRFSYSMALLREHVLHRLNTVVSPALGRIGLKGLLVVSGLPTSKLFEAKLQELVEGSLCFKEVLELIWMY